MDWGDVLSAAAAFFLVLTALGLTYALVRLAAALDRTATLLETVDREVGPLLNKATGTLDQVSGELEQVDRILTTAADGVESADRTVRRVGKVVEVPVEKAASAGAWVRGAASSFKARRDERGPQRSDDSWPGS